MRKVHVWGLQLCAVMMVATGAAGQEPEAERDTVPPRPFVEGGVYDKPYLTNLLGRTAIGGYAEAHARWTEADGVTDEAGFELRRWNIFAFTQVNDFIRMAAELEFEELAEEIAIEFAVVDFTIHRAFTVRAGAILTPLGRFNLAHDSPRNEFTDRPLVSTDLVGTALTEPGLGALGEFPLAGLGRLTYELYAVNGFNDGLIEDSPDGTRIPEGKKNFEDENLSPAGVGRLAWSPRLGYELAVSGHHGAYNVFRLDGERVDERRDLSIWAVDGEASVAGVEFSGEAVFATLDIPPGLDGIFASRQHGFYVQGVRDFGRGWIRTMPDSFFLIGGRYDLVDFDSDFEGDSEERFTVGLNFRSTQDTAFKLDYVRGWSRDRFNNLAETARVLFSVATYF